MGAGGNDINNTSARLSASLAKYQPKISDVAFKSLPLGEHLMSGKETQDGGLEIGIHFEYGKAQGVAAAGGAKLFSYYEELNLTPSDNVKTATVPFKSLAEPIVISWKETRENASPNRFKLLKQKTNNAVKSIKDELNDIYWGISGGTASMLPVDIPSIITGSGIGTGYAATVYGLAKASNTWMYSQEKADSNEFADNGLAHMRNVWNSCAANSPSASDHPTLLMTDQTVFEAYEDLLPPQYRTDSLKDGDIGFQQLSYKGVPLRFDRQCPTDLNGERQIFFINKNYLKLVVDSAADMKTWPFEWMGPRNFFWATQIVWSGNVICTNFASQGVQYGITVNT
jgi:hypothetical protein